MVWKRWVRRIVGGILATWFSITCWLIAEREYRRSTGNRELAVAINEAAATDPDWTWERLTANRPKPPSGRNGADVIPRVRELLPAEWVRDVSPERWEPDVPPLPPNTRYPARVVAESRRNLARAKPAVDLARTLKDCPSGHRDLPLTPDVLSTPVRDTPHTRIVACLLAWDATLAAEDADTARLADDLLAMLNASRSVGDEPLLISQLIRLSARILSVQALERALAQRELPDPSLGVLQTAWAADAEEPLLLYGVRGERAAYDVLFKNLADGTVTPESINGLPKPGVSFGGYAWWLRRGRIPAERALYIRWMTQAVEAAKRPPHEQLAAVQALPMPDLDDSNIRLTALFLTAVGKVALATLRSTAEARCAVAGIACERFRQKHQRWPVTLSELVPAFIPAVPHDPYTGEPLRYAKLDGGVVVYSVGKDRRDDGGTLTEPTEPTPTRARFRLWNLDQRRRPPPPDPVEPERERDP